MYNAELPDDTAITYPSALVFCVPEDNWPIHTIGSMMFLFKPKGIARRKISNSSAMIIKMEVRNERMHEDFIYGCHKIKPNEQLVLPEGHVFIGVDLVEMREPTDIPTGAPGTFRA